MKQRGFAVVYLLIGVLILAALVGAIYFGKPPVKLPFLEAIVPHPKVIELAKQDLATKLKVNKSEIVVEKTESVEWANGSLGCPKEGRMYIQVIIRGYRVIFGHNQNQYEYHTAGSEFVPCFENNKTTNPDLIEANWKTYTNNNYDFSVDYPAKFTYKELNSTITFSDPQDKSELLNNIIITILDGTKIQTEEVGKYFTVLQGKKWNDIKIGEFIGSYAETTGGILAKTTLNGYTATLNQKGKFIIFQLLDKENQKYISNQDFFQILSTFKFTQ